MEALAEALSAEPGVSVMGCATDPAEVLLALGSAPVDVLVVVIGVGDEGGLELARWAGERCPGLGVVLVSEPGARVSAREALEIGVRGWVRLDEPLSQLVAALGAVAAGDVFIPTELLSRALSESVALHPPHVASSLLSGLTPRQMDVLRCLIDGRSREQTAAALSMSPNTVRTHVGAILRRLQVHSALAAVVLARGGGLLGWSHESASTANGVGTLGR
ncbi:hypothetical protein N865_07710 [Intrasporangium oryzae NRRL B-24470]|uniref:LuxR family transcriptional regulator n=2 Tax=Intrasporangium TaxID=53357 RepID=W9GD20_9MICO|nr:hypothetical protein N865_07710 [Intrasporangium oryzae NRRL B-24470]